MRVAYIGNFIPEHSTENHVARAARSLGVEVVEHQENEVDWRTLAGLVSDVDFVLWTHTHGYAPEETHDAQAAFLAACPVPSVAFHLDRWWGLAREHQARTEPYFRCDVVVTADGGHDEQWASVGVNHTWFPPAVSAGECIPTAPVDDLRSPLAFVGSWSGYHDEWPHRRQLIRWLSKTYRDRIAFWPKPGEHAVRGDRLRQLYASVDVLVGDSCLAGGATRYWSDRIPETLGRGGFLIHPHVEGLDEHFEPGEHLVTWHAGAWDELASHIEHALDDSTWRRTIAEQGRAHVLAHHTYERRFEQLLALLDDRALVAA